MVPAAVLILFVATLVRSAFGFGEALLAVPLLALVMPVEVAAPVAVLVSVTIALIILLQDWRKVHLRSAGALVLSTMPGIPLGLLLLKLVPEPIVKAILALVIIGFSARSLRGDYGELANDDLAWLFGFGAGILGGAYGMNGPPLVVYGSLRKWSPQHFRATLQGYFLLASAAGLCGYAFAGFWTPAVNHLYLMSLPLVIAATLLGRAINRRIHPRRFLVYVHVTLILIGLLLLAQAVIRVC